MTYSPGTPGFPSAQPPGSYGPSTPPFGAGSAEVESKLPHYLRIAVIVLGLGVYLANFGPIVTVADADYPLVLGDAGYTVPLAVLGALLAWAGLLPKAKNYTAVVAVVATLGALLAISTVAGDMGDYTIGWGLWLVLAFSLAQAGAAIGSLLLESGVVNPPAPRPKYDPYAQYGLPPGNSYYGQPGQPGQPNYGNQGRQAPPAPGYPSYGGYSPAPSSGGFGAQPTPPGAFGTGAQHSAPQGPPTPPTGFPSFTPPTAGGSSATGGQSAGGSGQATTGGEQAQGGSAPSGPAQP